jgi:hypothetical protein
MPSYIPINFEQQQLNQLGQIGVQQRGTLIPTNDYFQTNQYSATNPDALATGDVQGKGTGNDGLLNAYDFVAGNNRDVQERASEVAINYYKAQVPYTTPSV